MTTTRRTAITSYTSAARTILVAKGWTEACSYISPEGNGVAYVKDGRRLAVNGNDARLIVEHTEAMTALLKL